MINDSTDRLFYYSEIFYHLFIYAEPSYEKFHFNNLKRGVVTNN